MGVLALYLDSMRLQLKKKIICKEFFFNFSGTIESNEKLLKIKTRTSKQQKQQTGIYLTSQRCFFHRKEKNKTHSKKQIYKI